MTDQPADRNGGVRAGEEPDEPGEGDLTEWVSSLGAVPPLELDEQDDGQDPDEPADLDDEQGLPGVA